MNYEILTKPSYALVEVALEPNEQVVGDSGAMTWIEGSVETTTTTLQSKNNTTDNPSNSLTRRHEGGNI